MATFTWVPSYGSRLRRAPKNDVAQFLDGYAQRSPSGINHNPQRWSLIFDVSPAVADAIDAFLVTSGGHTPFDWTPPRGVAAKFVCPEHEKGEESYGKVSVTATFEQDFAP